MRYYDIAITDPKGNPVIPSSLQGAGFTSITSLLPGTTQTNIAALDIELDIVQLPNQLASTASYVRIFGLGLQDLSASFSLGMGPSGASTPSFPGYGITLRAGMAQGLPLANPQQQGIVAQGSIWQAFGNWILTDMTVDIYFMPKMGSSNLPSNFSFNWPSGMPLKTALTNLFSVAMPGFTPSINIRSIILPSNESGFYPDFATLASYIYGITGPTSPVNMSVTANNTIMVYDGTVTPTVTAKKIDFQDLVGQITWAAPFQITAKLVMRGDLNINDIVNFPPSIVTTTGAALLRLSDASNFNGNFRIDRIQHWGRFRQPDAASWNTTIWCSVYTSGSTATTAAQAVGTSWTSGPGPSS